MPTTPLMVAVRGGHREVVGVLLGAGADPGITNQARETPLSLAKAAGDQGMMQLLEEHQRTGGWLFRGL